MAAGGSPAIGVEPTDRAIFIDFAPPPPSVCPDIYDPVCGLQGDFGPLDSGIWTFSGENETAEFAMRFLVPSDGDDGDAAWLEGTVPPAGLLLECADGICEGLVEFTVPLPQVFGNGCEAGIGMQGLPVVTVNTGAKTVEVWFTQPYDSPCPDVWLPVCGVAGSFGPLEPGLWTFLYSAGQIDIK